MGATQQEFATGLRDRLMEFFHPCEVDFRGDVGAGSADEWSEVSVVARLDCPLTAGCLASLEAALTGCYGPACFRYNPKDLADPVRQSLRVSFYGQPVFWQVTLVLMSSAPTPRPLAVPLAPWTGGDVALGDVITSLRWLVRRQGPEALAALRTAAARIGVTELTGPDLHSALAGLLAALGKRTDVDCRLLEMTRMAAARRRPSAVLTSPGATRSRVATPVAAAR